MPLSAALANQREDSGLYIGGAYGAFSVDDNNFNDNDTAPQIFGGVQFNPYIGVEAAYLDFGSSGNDRLGVDLERDETGTIANGDFDSKVNLLSAGLQLEF